MSTAVDHGCSMASVSITRRELVDCGTNGVQIVSMHEGERQDRRANYRTDMHGQWFAINCLQNTVHAQIYFLYVNGPDAKGASGTRGMRRTEMDGGHTVRSALLREVYRAVTILRATTALHRSPTQ